MKTVFLSSAYLAPIEYYTKLLAYDKVFIEHDVMTEDLYDSGMADEILSI